MKKEGFFMRRTLLTTTLVALAIPSVALAGPTFSQICTSDYSDWKLHDPMISMGSQPGFQQGCGDFYTEMKSFGTQLFYWGTGAGEIHGLEEGNYWEQQVERNDIVLWAGHSGAWSFEGSDLTGQYYIDDALSKNMKLGNGSPGVSILGLWGCATLAPYARSNGPTFDPAHPEDCKCVPGNESFWGSKTAVYPAAEDLWPRWSTTMQAGLRMIVGGWDVYHDTRSIGDKFGKYLAAGNLVWDAWRNASLESGAGNTTPAVVAGGTDQTDCFKRIDNMTAKNFNNGSFPRRTGSSMAYMCWAVAW
jgi:hypothetical protein